MAMGKNPQIEKICEGCGKDFKTYPYRKNTARFCSMKCQTDWQKGKHHHASTEFKKGSIPYNYIGELTDYNGRRIFRKNCKVNYMYRIKVEDAIKRSLDTKEHVHHKDANKLNDVLDNFLILTNGNHKKVHAKAYDYLVQTGQIDEYLIWLKVNYSEIEWKTVAELAKGVDVIC